MYQSDKTIFEHGFPLFMLGVVALNALEGERSEQFARPVKTQFLKMCETKDTQKIIRRCWNVANNLMHIVQDKNQNKVDGHKFILILHSLTQKILDSGYVLPPEVIAAFAPFLDLEAAQQKKWATGEIITDEDWLKMKASADKMAARLFLRLREQGYYKSKQGE